MVRILVIFSCMIALTSCDKEEDQLTIGSSSAFYLPNGFTPNGDGVNDTFGPVFRSADSSSVVDYDFRIYNSDRELLFETDDTEERWDGTDTSDRLQADGSYIYKIKMAFADGHTDRLKGFVSILNSSDE